MPSKHPAWRAGDLLVILREHVIYRAEMGKPRTSCFLTTGDQTKLEQLIPAKTIVMAVEDQPSSGQLAMVRVVHEGNIWVINSNYVVKSKSDKGSDNVLL